MKPASFPPRIAYKVGKIYISEHDNCITDEYNDKNHLWQKGNNILIADYFKKIKGNKIF